MMVEGRVNSVVAKKLWNLVRVAFFMMRKGLVSKRKLIMDMNLMMKRGKLIGKTLSNLLHHHHHHPRPAAPGGSGIRDYYEFSCSNSPNPVFFHMSKRKHHYFPCINPPVVLEMEGEEEVGEKQKAVVVLPTTPEYTFNFEFNGCDMEASAEQSPIMLSPFSVRVSNYSSEDENEDGCENGQVDYEAEKFITRFYEQLRLQKSPLQLYASHTAH